MFSLTRMRFKPPRSFHPLITEIFLHQHLSAVGGRRVSALLTPQHLFPWYSPSPGDYRREQWVGNSNRLSLMLPCSPSDSVLMHSLFLSVSLLHQLSRVPALLRGHPSKVLTQALQQLIAASWCVICRVAKGMVITRTSICSRCSFVPPFSKTKPEAFCWGLSFYCSLKKDVRSGIWTRVSRDCALDRPAVLTH